MLLGLNVFQVLFAQRGQNLVNCVTDLGYEVAAIVSRDCVGEWPRPCDLRAWTDVEVVHRTWQRCQRLASTEAQEGFVRQRNEFNNYERGPG